MTSKWQNHTRTDLARFSSHFKQGKTNLLCPAGIGDLYWICSKFQPYFSECMFWFPDSESHRAAPLAEMLGLDYGYMPGLTTEFVWSQDGGTPYDPKSAMFVHANRHLECGNPIKSWMPELPLDYPVIHSGFQPPVKRGDYICIFTCGEHYMGGQLHSTVWANIIKCIQQSTGMKIVLIGAGSDLPLCSAIQQTYPSTDIIPVFDQPFHEALGWIQNCNTFLSVASGWSILASCLGVKTLSGYPRHLDKMPGTFEPNDSVTDWVFLDELPNHIFNYKHNDLVMG